MGLFDSGIKSPGQFFDYTYIAAGRYTFICLLHSEMTGTVKVPIKAKPKSGTQLTTFTITPAEGTAPAGFVYDIQIFRPGGPGFVDWKTITTKNTTFVPDAGIGQYQFQARLRKTADNSASLYSQPVTITVTSR